MKSVLIAFVLFSVLAVGGYAQQWRVDGQYWGSSNTQRDFETRLGALVSEFRRSFPRSTFRWVDPSATTRTDDLILERARRELPRRPARRSGWMIEHFEQNVLNAYVFFYVDSNGNVFFYLLRITL